MCCQSVHEHPDGGLNTEMDGGGRPAETDRQTDRHGMERGLETERDLERWRERDSNVQIQFLVAA